MLRTTVLIRTAVPMALVAGLMAGTALGQTEFDVSDGNWSADANWTSGEPTSSTEAQINNGGTAHITSGNSEAANGTMITDGMLSVEGGALDSAASIQIANGAGTSGSYQQSGGLVEVSGGGGDFNIGAGGNGSATITSGEMTLSDRLQIGTTGDSEGTLNMEGGSITMSNHYYVGENGSATVNHSSGTVEAFGAHWGNNEGATADYNMSGGTVNVAYTLVGNNGTTSFNFSDGTFEVYGPNNTPGDGNGGFVVGNQSSGQGSVTQTGGSLGVNNYIVGADGSGSHSISGGSLTVNNTAEVGASGSLTVSGSGSTIEMLQQLLADDAGATLGFELDGSGVSLIDVVGSSTIQPATVDMGLLAGASPQPGDTFDLINAEAIDGTPSLATADQSLWSLDVVSGNGGQTLQAEYVPEPTTMSLLGLGVGSLLIRRRRQVG